MLLVSDWPFLWIALCVPLYIVSPLSTIFAIIYIVCELSDILDGFIARKTGTSSKCGAILDSIADFIGVCVILIKIMPIVGILREVLAWILYIEVIRLASSAVDGDIFLMVYSSI